MTKPPTRPAPREQLPHPQHPRIFALAGHGAPAPGIGWLWVGLLVLLLLVGLAGGIEAEEQELARAAYCDGVKAGQWPDDPEYACNVKATD